jgi:hypothetical protein
MVDPQDCRFTCVFRHISCSHYFATLPAAFRYRHADNASTAPTQLSCVWDLSGTTGSGSCQRTETIAQQVSTVHGIAWPRRCLWYTIGEAIPARGLLRIIWNKASRLCIKVEVSLCRGSPDVSIAAFQSLIVTARSGLNIVCVSG